MNTTQTTGANGVRQDQDRTLADLGRIVEQAEALLQTLSEEGSEAVESVRRRVLRTMGQAKARMADSRDAVREAATSAAQRGDQYVHENPWKSVAIAAGIGAVVALLLASQMRREP